MSKVLVAISSAGTLKHYMEKPFMNWLEKEVLPLDNVEIMVYGNRQLGDLPFHYCEIGGNQWADDVIWATHEAALETARNYNFDAVVFQGLDCFSGEERYITCDGPKTFLDTVGTKQKVLTENGFEEADIKYFGRRKTQKITFKRSVMRKSPYFKGETHPYCHKDDLEEEIWATPNHKWLLHDGTITSSLKEGDYVVTNTTKCDKNSDDYWRGFSEGMVFGDGSYTKRIKETGEYSHQIQLYGDAGDYSHLFDKISFSQSLADRVSSYKGTATLKASRNLKTTLPQLDNINFLTGFVEGWLQADAHQKDENRYFLSSTNREALDWLVDIAPMAGYIVGNLSLINRSKGSFDNAKEIYNLRLYKSGAQNLFKVKSITDTRLEAVYCAVVPNTNKFTLGCGIYTHNCITTTPGDYAKLLEYANSEYDIIAPVQMGRKDAHYPVVRNWTRMVKVGSIWNEGEYISSKQKDISAAYLKGYSSTGIVPVGFPGTEMCLINKQCFNIPIAHPEYKFWYATEEEKYYLCVHEFWMLNAARQGFRAWVDTTIETAHCDDNGWAAITLKEPIPNEEVFKIWE